MPSILVRDLEVAGTNFRDAATKVALEALAGRDDLAVALEPEPTNAHDPLALKVLIAPVGGTPLWVGYWPKTTSGWAIAEFCSNATPMNARAVKHPTTGRVVVLLNAVSP